MSQAEKGQRQTPQAAYQARRRQMLRPVTFFPPDRAAMDAAIAASDLSQQQWLARAVDEKIARDARRAQLAAVLDEAKHKFGAQVFWNFPDDRPVEEIMPSAIKALRKYGGMRGFHLATRMQELAES